MKRNYFMPAIGSVIGVGLLASGLLASASTPWKSVLSDGEDAHPTNQVRKTPAVLKRLTAGMSGNPDNTVMPAYDGLRSIPRPAKVREMKPNSILRSIQAPRATLYGIVNRFPSMDYTYQAYIGELNPSTGRLTPLYSGPQFSPFGGDDYIYQGNSYRKGDVICSTYASVDVAGGATTTKGIWTTYDLLTGDLTGTYTFDDSRANAYSITYDPDLDIFFTCSIDLVSDQGHSIFGIVNPNFNGTGEWRYIYGGKLETTTGIKPFIAAIAYNPVAKEVYAFDNFNHVYSIEWGEDPNRTPDPILVEIGDINLEDGAMLFGCDDTTNPIPGQIVYSPMDEVFIAAYRDNFNMKNRVVFVETEMFDGKIGADIIAPETPYIASILCTDDFASSNAPMLAPTPELTFAGAALNGQVKLTAPTESFVGVDLTGTTFQAVTKIDGKVIDTRNVKAGETFTLPLDLAQGQHVLEFTTAIGEDVSPVNTVNFYVGYDAPAAVKNIELKGNTLTWDAATAVGAHQGYVDLNDVTYNVYLSGQLQNTTPIKENKYVLTAPADMKVYDITVEAVSQGQTSPSAGISKIFGKAFELPFLQTPTQDQSQNYTVINANEDDRRFYWGRNLSIYEGMIFQTGYLSDADDWLILPAVHLPDASKLYEFAVDIRGVMAGMNTQESYEIWVGTDPTVKGMTTMLYSTPKELFESSLPQHKAFNFAVAEAGDYYIGFHVTSTRAQSAQGLTLHNFQVKEVDGASSAVPAEPENVSLVAADFGEQAAILTATLPTVDILGKPLPADDEITLTLTYIDDTATPISRSASGKPGETIKVTNGSNGDGFTVYTVTPSNKNGSGYTKSYSVYVGMDVPLHPDNIHGVPTQDNLGMIMEWDAPSEVGYNGGFVDFDDLGFHYNFYIQTGAVSTYLTKIAETRETNYTYYPYGKGVGGPLASFYMGPTAVNQAGESIESIFVREDLGTPYELPIKEEWGTTHFDLSPYTFLTSGAYSASYWENASSTAQLGVGAAVFVQGGLIGSAERACKGKLILPKFSTHGIKKSVFKLRFWDYSKAPSSIQVYARSNKKDEETLVGEFNAAKPLVGRWNDGEVYLPEDLSDADWVQLRLGVNFSGDYSEYLVLDSFQVIDDADFDLKVSEFDGITEATVGDDISFHVVVANCGRERMDGTLKIELLDESGSVLDVVNEDIATLNSNQTAEFDADFHLAFSNPTVTVRATIEGEDENMANNVKELTLLVRPSAIAVVSDLQAIKHDDIHTVDLSWSAPSTTYGNFENFEAYSPFDLSETFDYWQNINGDDLWPIHFQNQSTGQVAEWPNSDQKRGWQIYNYEELGFTNERLIPHSGKQALLAICGGYDENSAPIQSSKWLVSPLCQAGTEISFWYSTFESGTTEYVEIWTCEKANGKLDPNDKNLAYGRAGDFRKIASKSKVGSDIWDYVSYLLTSREVKFALRYCSYNGYGAAIDDISFTPAEMITRTPESYNVYRCNKYGTNPKLIAENVTGTSYTDKDWDGKECSYYVVANNTVDGKLVSGSQSNFAYVAVSGVDEITAGQSVAAGKGQIMVNGFAGSEVVISAADGKIVVKAPVKSDAALYNVEKGVYLVTVNKHTFKVVVK